MSTIIAQNGVWESIIDAGLRLAELPESEGGWQEYFCESDAGDLRIEDPILRAQTALMMENAKRWLWSLCKGQRNSQGNYVINEATRSALVGGFSDYLFPVVRAAFPTNPINDLVSVQPTTRRTATVIYWNWILGSNKGSYVKGQRVFDALTGRTDASYNYSSEVVPNESQGALGSANATFSGTLAYHDGGGVRPGTVSVSATLTSGGAKVFYDNAAGAFTCPGVAITASSIDYQTGVWSITLTSTTFTTAAVLATYRWDSEGSSMIPEMDIQITSSTVDTERRAMKISYSQESMFDVMQEFGQSLEPQLVSGCAEQINFEIARQLIARMWAVAPVSASFALTGPTEYSRQDHFRDFSYTINTASNSIWRRTQKAYGNWIVADEGAANLIESLPAGMFQPAPQPANVQGLHFIGTLLGKYRVYKDIHLVNMTGASAYGNMLMGFKGTQFWEAGLVWSPYQLMYTTDALTTADFITQKGMASRYATKMVNPDMYCRISLTA